MMNTTQTQTAPDFDPTEGMFSGWTDEEISAYEAFEAENARYADTLPAWPGTVDAGEPPF